MITTAELITAALNDAADAPAGSTIYKDPQVGGLAWQRHENDYVASGPIGYEADDYGDRYDEDDDTYAARIAAVETALRDAGYTVA